MGGFRVACRLRQHAPACVRASLGAHLACGKPCVRCSRRPARSGPPTHHAPAAAFTPPRFDIVTLKCTAQGVPAGYAACPAGMERCRVGAWRRPLCAAANMITGVDSCELFESLALAHKLPKLACPAL